MAEIRILHSQLLTNSHFYFLILVKSVPSSVASTAQTNDLSQGVILQHDSETSHSTH
jgi:hypothetical protein